MAYKLWKFELMFHHQTLQQLLRLLLSMFVCLFVLSINLIVLCKCKFYMRGNSLKNEIKYFLYFQGFGTRLWNRQERGLAHDFGAMADRRGGWSTTLEHDFGRLADRKARLEHDVVMEHWPKLCPVIRVMNFFHIVLQIFFLFITFHNLYQY